MAAILLILSPFLIDGYPLARYLFTNESIPTFLQIFFVRVTIFTIVSTVVVFIIVIFTVVKSRNRTFSVTAKIERWLIFQALVSGILMILSYALPYIRMFIYLDEKSVKILYLVAQCIYNLHTYLVISLHFIFSPKFRKAFIQFYANFFPCRKQPKSVKVTQVTLYN